MLTKSQLAGLRECADWSRHGPSFGMHSAWKPKTMAKLEALGLVRLVPDCRSHGVTGFKGWRLTDAGVAKLKEYPEC